MSLKLSKLNRGQFKVIENFLLNNLHEYYINVTY